MPTGNFGPGYPAIQAQNVAPVASAGSGGVSEMSVASAEGYALGTVTIAGTVGAGPTVTVTIAGHPVTYTYVSGDTTASIAAGHIAAAINADTTDSGVVVAAASSAVITITAKKQGVSGMLSLAASVTGGATAAVSGSELDFANGVVVPTASGSVSVPGAGGVISLYAGVPISVDPATKSYLRTQGLVA